MISSKVSVFSTPMHDEDPWIREFFKQQEKVSEMTPETALSVKRYVEERRREDGPNWKELVAKELDFPVTPEFAEWVEFLVEVVKNGEKK